MKKTDLHLRFARALYAISVQEGQMADYFEQLNQIVQLCSEKKLLKNLELLAFLETAKIEQILNNLLGKTLKPAMLNLLVLLIANRQVKLIFSIKKVFQKTYFEAEQINEVVICSSRELAEKEKTQLVAKLTSKLGKVYLDYTVDHHLIAGLQIYNNGKLTDFSLRSQLEYLRREMLEEQLVY